MAEYELLDQFISKSNEQSIYIVGFVLALSIIARAISDHFNRTALTRQTIIQREKEQEREQKNTQALIDISKTQEQIINFISYIKEDSVNNNNEKVKKIIDVFLKSTRQDIFYYTRIYINNPIYKDEIEDTIKELCISQYKKLVDNLSTFEYNNKKISSVINEIWFTDTAKEIIFIINTNIDNKNKLDKINSKLKTLYDNYSTIIKEKIM